MIIERLAGLKLWVFLQFCDDMGQGFLADRFSRETREAVFSLLVSPHALRFFEKTKGEYGIDPGPAFVTLRAALKTVR